jgi:hypothetical protein
MANNESNVQVNSAPQVVGAVENPANNNAETSPKKGPSNKRAYKQQPVYQLLRHARNQYNHQLDKDAETKRRCIKAALAASPDLYPDQLHFELDFRVERERLVDSKRFCNSCKSLDLNPYFVADNIVFEGKTVLEKVLKDGLQVIGEKVHIFNAPLWHDSEGIYKQEVVNG